MKYQMKFLLNFNSCIRGLAQVDNISCPSFVQHHKFSIVHRINQDGRYYSTWNYILYLLISLLLIFNIEV